MEEPQDLDDEDELEIREDEERVPLCLLLATSLFKLKKNLVGYAELLCKRSLIHPFTEFDKRVAWRNEGFKTSGKIVQIATALLRHLGLPVETKMSYMAACERGFRCLCCHHGPDSRNLSWPELVSIVS